MIIESLLDTDLYKFTMMQVVLHHFPAAQVEYRFKCRNADVDLQPYADEIRREIAHLCTLRFTPREIDYLRSWRFFKSDFVDLLGLFRLDERFIQVSASIPSGTTSETRGPGTRAFGSTICSSALRLLAVWSRRTWTDRCAVGRRRAIMRRPA